MFFSAECMDCLIRTQFQNIKHYDDADKKAEFMREAMAEIIKADPNECAPYVFARMDDLQVKYFGTVYGYEKEKKQFNDIMLSVEDRLRAEIDSIQDDPGRLLHALKLSLAGNYIDFGALKEVSEETLMSLIDNCVETEIDPVIFEQLRSSIASSEMLTVVTDNCGEIVCDKLFLEEVRRQFPDIKLNVVVRGGKALNDATMDDALYVGLDRAANVISSETNIAGNPLKYISEKARTAIENSGTVISKGQANFETMAGCGLNIFYIFLCKCDYFTKVFNVERFTPMFLSEKTMEKDPRYFR